jgi:hypothetical protein
MGSWRPSDTQLRMGGTTYIAQLRSIYAESRDSLLKKLSVGSLSGFQKQRATSLLSQVNAAIAQLDMRAYRWAKNSLSESYNTGIKYAEKSLREQNVVRGVNYDAAIHKKAIEALVDDVSIQLLSSNTTIKAGISRLIRETQQKVLEDTEISKTIAAGITEGATREEVSNKLLTSFQNEIGQGNFIKVGSKQYDPADYAELVARTRTREATTLGTINTALQYGVDLVQVSEHEDIDGIDICNEFEGKIFSLSGTSKIYPELTQRPPFHPNCRHVLTPITAEGAAKRSAAL